MKLLLSTIKSNNPATELALRYLYSVIADAPVENTVKFFDKYDSVEDIYEYVIRSQYTVVYFHCDEYNERYICDLCELIKKASPVTSTVVGGMQVSFDTKSFMMENPCVDFVVRGEGETVLFNLIRSMITYEYDFGGIPGLAYRYDDEIKVNPYDKSISFEELPFPYEKTELIDTSVVYYESIRGTSDRTIYRQYLPDARVRALPLGRVCTELRYFLVKGVSKVVFMDKWFNYNSERAYRIFEYIINNDNGKTTFVMDIDGDNLDEETVRILAEAREGLFEFNINAASTNAETLAAIGRKENIYQLMYNVTKLLQADNIKTNLSITAGLPFETEQLFARSFNKIYGLGEGKSLSIDIIKLPKGCLLREESDKYGYLYSNSAPYEAIATGFMPATDLIKIRSISRISRLFINDNFAQSIPRMLNDTGMRPYELFDKLTDYIYTNRLTDKLNKIENLYRILYGFAVSTYDDVIDTLKLQMMIETIHDDLENSQPLELVKRFEKKGWEIEA